MDTKLKFSCWLIGKLKTRKMTYKEIADEWYASTSNPYQEPLTKRTFHRYLNDIYSQFGVEIACDRANGHVYHAKFSPLDSNEVTEWVLSSLRMASLGEKIKYHPKVLLDRAPLNTEFLDDILSAIDKHYPIHFHYTTAYGKSFETDFIPAFVRLFKQRWYVIGIRLDDGCVRTFPFDRMSNLQVNCVSMKIDKTVLKLPNPESFYTGTYGIIREDNLRPEQIRFRAFYPQYNFIEEVPLHESQRMIYASPDDEYRDYEVTVRPSFDFKQELLSYGQKLTVLAPESFRQEMIEMIENMLHSYRTGENTMDE